MKFVSFLSAALVSLGLALLAGCTSYYAQTMPGTGLTGVKHYFVLTNLNDNHGLDREIVAALRHHGFDAESGPHTMMPDESEVVIAYEDQWSWDFGDHLLGLRLIARNRKTSAPVATVNFFAKICGRKTTSHVIGELVDRMLAAKKG